MHVDEEDVEVEGPNQDIGPPSLPAGEGVTFRDRIRALRTVDREAAHNLCLDTVFQYMTTKTPVHLVAERLGYSTGWVERKRQQVRDRIKRDGETMDVRSYLTEMLQQLDEVSALGFREMATADVPAREGSPARDHSARRLKGADVARGAIRDKAVLLQAAGALDGAPLRPMIQGSDAPEAEATNVLKRLSEDFLNRRYHRDDIEAASKTKNAVIDHD